MAYTVTKVDIWQAEIEDRVGGLDEKLAALAEAGVDLEFVVARRQPQASGKGIVYLSGIKGAKASKAAGTAGFVKSSDVFGLRVEGKNSPGDCHKVLARLSKAGINLRGVSASVIGGKYVMVLAFDSSDDATKAARTIRAA
jgi:hypothetical protein